MNDTVTIDKDEYDRLTAIERQARLCRSRQREFYGNSRLRSDVQRRKALQDSIRAERALDTLLAYGEKQAELPL